MKKLFMLVMLLLCAVTFISTQAAIETPLANAAMPAVNTDGLIHNESTTAHNAPAATPTPEIANALFFEEIPLDVELQTVLFETCDKYNIEYALALGLIQAESNFDPCISNSSGCYGLCQLSPLYFPADLTPAENIENGLAYLAASIEKYGDIAAGLTAYNAGHDNGTRNYANVVLNYATAWRSILNAK